MPEGWFIPEGRAIAVRPAVVGLPLGYAALLITLSMQLAFSMHQVGAAIVVFGGGWLLGKLLTGHDPFAWELFAASARAPRALVP